MESSTSEPGQFPESTLALLRDALRYYPSGIRSVIVVETQDPENWALVGSLDCANDLPLSPLSCETLIVSAHSALAEAAGHSDTASSSLLLFTSDECSVVLHQQDSYVAILTLDK